MPVTDQLFLWGRHSTAGQWLPGAQTAAPLNLPHACCPRAAWQLCGPGPAASGGTYLPEQGPCIRERGGVKALCPLQEVSLHLGRVSWLLAKGERGFRVKTLEETETNRDLAICTARSQDLLLLHETPRWRQDQTVGELPAASCQFGLPCVLEAETRPPPPGPAQGLLWGLRVQALLPQPSAGLGAGRGLPQVSAVWPSRLPCAGPTGPQALVTA